MNCKLLFLVIVIYFFFFSTCKEGYNSFNTGELVHVDDEVEEDNFFQITKREKHPSLLNVYGEPLQSCREHGSNDTRGSWTNGFCSEMKGGVHQICLDVDKTDDFSKNTGQGNWTDKRKGKSHCMCLGAWALYKAKQEKGLIPKTDNELNCESIMDDALHDRYVDKWNTWNGHELENQIVHGVNELYKQCYEKGTTTQKEYIKQLYKDLTSSRPEFHTTDIHKKYT
jgi:hypothetical protein